MNLTVLNLTFLGLASAVLWGMSDFLGGLASRRAPALLIVVIAHSISLGGLVSAALLTHATWPSKRLIFWGLITGISGGMALIAFYRALAIGEMGLAAALAGVLTAMAPIVFSWFAEGAPKVTEMVGFALAGVAIWLIAYQPGGTPQRRGLWLATFAGLGFGVFLISSKFASQGALLWPLALSRMASASLALALLIAARLPRGGDHRALSESQIPDPIAGPVHAGPVHAGPVHAGPVHAGPVHAGPVHDLAHSPSGRWKMVVLLAGSAGVLEVVGNLLYMMGTRVGRLDVVAVLASLYPAVTILMAVWVLKERTRRAQAWGIVLALAAVVAISI